MPIRVLAHSSLCQLDCAAYTTNVELYSHWHDCLAAAYGVFFYRGIGVVGCVYPNEAPLPVYRLPVADDPLCRGLRVGKIDVGIEGLDLERLLKRGLRW